MAQKKVQSIRWKKERKPWTASGKPRKPYTRGETPRKKRVAKTLPIPAKGDVVSLATHRKRLSKKKLGDRLQILSNKQFKTYAARAKITERHARRDRGRHRHTNRLTELQKNAAVTMWRHMTERTGKPGGAQGCTQAHLRARLKTEHRIVVSRSALSRILLDMAAGAKKRAFPYVHHNRHNFKTNKDRT